MTIEQLIGVLKKNDKSVYGVLENWFNELLDTVKFEELEEKYNLIYGFIWGLYTTEYITVSETEQLTTNLLEMYRERSYEIY